MCFNYLKILIIYMSTDKRISPMKVTLTVQTPLSIQDKFLGVILCMYIYMLPLKNKVQKII